MMDKEIDCTACDGVGEDQHGNVCRKCGGEGTILVRDERRGGLGST